MFPASLPSSISYRLFFSKRLVRYYLNGVDAFRLKLWFPVELREASKAAREARAAEAAGATEATEAAAGELT